MKEITKNFKKIKKDLFIRISRTKNLLSYVLGGVSLVLLIIVICQAIGCFGGVRSVSKDKSAEQAIDFIRNNLVGPGTQIFLKEVDETSGVYEIKIDIMGQEGMVHMTKDAKILFLQPFDLQKSEALPGF